MDSKFVNLQQKIPNLLADIRYFGSHNFAARPIDGYDKPIAYLCAQAADALAMVAKDAGENGLRLLVYDAYRPACAVRDFYSWAQQDGSDAGRAEFYPDFSDKRELFARGYIALHSSHSRASTVDLTLTDAHGIPLDMGGTFDYFGARSAYACDTLTAEQRENRKRLHDAMLRRGFVPYAEEWWHFTLDNEPYPDTYFEDRIE